MTRLRPPVEHPWGARRGDCHGPGPARTQDAPSEGSVPGVHGRRFIRPSHSRLGSQDIFPPPASARPEPRNRSGTLFFRLLTNRTLMGVDAWAAHSQSAFHKKPSLASHIPHQAHFQGVAYINRTTECARRLPEWFGTNRNNNRLEEGLIPKAASCHLCSGAPRGIRATRPRILRCPAAPRETDRPQPLPLSPRSDEIAASAGALTRRMR